VTIFKGALESISGGIPLNSNTTYKDDIVQAMKSGAIEIYPGSRRQRALPVEECASVWPGCRPGGA